MKRRFEPILLLPLLVLVSCAEDPVPKPRGWFRIDLPQQQYVPWEAQEVVGMEIPAYTRMLPRDGGEGGRWFDLRFPGQRATVHLTWSPVNGGMQELIEGAHAFKSKHEAKAARIRSERVLRSDDRVFGTLFEVEGDVASPMVFYLTDSTDNFLYGALYFDVRPNSDSLAPVTERLRADMRHMVATLRWL